MDLGQIAIQLTIIEDSAESARKVAAHLVCLGPPKSALAIVQGNQINDQAAALEQEKKAAGAEFFAQIQRLIAQAKQLEACVTAKPDPKLKLAQGDGGG